MKNFVKQLALMNLLIVSGNWALFCQGMSLAAKLLYNSRFFRCLFVYHEILKFHIEEDERRLCSLPPSDTVDIDSAPIGNNIIFDENNIHVKYKF